MMIFGLRTPTGHPHSLEPAYQRRLTKRFCGVGGLCSGDQYDGTLMERGSPGLEVDEN